MEEKTDEERSLANATQKLPYKRGILQLTCSPAPDKVIIGGVRGERILDGGSTTLTLELREGDEWVELKRQRYQAKKIPIPKWEHGGVIIDAALLDPEI